MLSNAYLIAKFRFDTAENEPAKQLQNFTRIFRFFLARCLPFVPGYLFPQPRWWSMANEDRVYAVDPSTLRQSQLHARHVGEGRMNCNATFSRSVSTSNFTIQDTGFSIFRHLQDRHAFVPLRNNKLQSLLKNFRIFAIRR